MLAHNLLIFLKKEVRLRDFKTITVLPGDRGLASRNDGRKNRPGHAESAAKK